MFFSVEHQLRSKPRAPSTAFSSPGHVACVFRCLSLAAFPVLTPPTCTRSTVEGATVGLTKILGGCWALTYLALVVGNPKFQTMLDPSLLPVQDVPVSALAVSGGGSGSKKSAAAAVETCAAGAGETHAGIVGGGDCSAAPAAERGRRGFGGIGTVRRWAERRGRLRESRRNRRHRARVCGDELESSGGGGARVVVTAPMVVRAGK